MRAELDVLEEAIGYRFRERDILSRALTHTSLVHEKAAAGEPTLGDNEQMEFLGDAVLGFLVSEVLVAEYPSLPEGELSKLKAHLVSATHLHCVAQKLDLGEYLLLGRGEELTGGRGKKALLADAVEALIAGVYLDGGIDAARRLVNQHVTSDLATLWAGAALPIIDFKSALQELAQARKLPPPRYSVIKERGPEHAKTFTVEVRVGHDFAANADALSKKSAGQKAAQSLLEKLTAESA